MSMLSCWGYCILCFEDSTLVELAFPCFIWGNESKVCLGLVNFCSAGQNIDFIWLNCCKKTISEYIRTTRKEPIKQTCNIPTTWRTWKKHRAKIGHDLYIYTVDFIYFFLQGQNLACWKSFHGSDGPRRWALWADRYWWSRIFTFTSFRPWIPSPSYWGTPKLLGKPHPKKNTWENSGSFKF